MYSTDSKRHSRNSEVRKAEERDRRRSTAEAMARVAGARR